MTTRTSMATVEFRDVRFSYGAMPILDGASLELEAGTFSVLAGSNGSGKSTLLKLCLGLLQPDEGTVEVFGAAPHDAAARRRIGYAPQGLRMATTLPVSVTEVVAAGLAPTRGWFGRLDKTGWTQVERAIDSVGLGDLSRECMFELSGGQQQRAILARALVGEPDLLLLDEPTTGIDQRFRPALAKELRRRADAGATIVAVSHDPDDFHSVSDRILVLVDGQLQQVSHEEFHTHLDWGGRGAGGDR